MVEVEVTHARVILPVKYDDEDIPYDFPLRKGDIWDATIEIDSGKIVDWPGGSGDVVVKVTDSGMYILTGPDGELTRIEDYVPHGVVPGSYGDYVDLAIKDGVITNWPKKPNFSDFFPKQEDD